MTSKRLIIPNEILMPEIERKLGEGATVQLRAKGRSMYPYIRDGHDVLIIEPIANNTVNVGDIVLARVEPSKWVVHRIKSIDGDVLTLKGDGNIRGTEKCRCEDVKGKLNSIKRGKKIINCNTRGQKLKANILHAAFVTLYYVKAIIKKTLRICIL